VAFQTHNSCSIDKHFWVTTLFRDSKSDMRNRLRRTPWFPVVSPASLSIKPRPTLSKLRKLFAVRQPTITSVTCSTYFPPRSDQNFALSSGSANIPNEYFCTCCLPSLLGQQAWRLEIIREKGYNNNTNVVESLWSQQTQKSDPSLPWNKPVRLVTGFNVYVSTLTHGTSVPQPVKVLR